MKKTNLVLCGLVSAVCMTAAVGLLNNAQATVVGQATTNPAAEVSLSSTVYKVSKDDSKLLAVTAIKDFSKVYEIGYEFDGYTVTDADFAETKTYYDSLKTAGETQTASDIFGADWTDAKLLVWEVTNVSQMSFTAYALEGVMDGEVLTIPDTEIKVTAATRNNNKYTVSFVNDNESELQSIQVYNGRTPAYTGEVPMKAASGQYTYTFKSWDKTIAPVTDNVTYKATYKPCLNKTAVTEYEVYTGIAENVPVLNTAALSVDLTADLGDYEIPDDMTWTMNGTDVSALINVNDNVVSVNGIANYVKKGSYTVVGQSDSINVNIPVTFITKILRTKDDVNAMSKYAKAVDAREKYWDGYFVLANDINFGGSVVTPVATHASGANGDGGFLGTIDGRGYNIDGMAVNKEGWGFVGGMLAGSSLKNISFTNAVNAGGTAFISISVTDPVIENVYLHYKSVDVNMDWTCLALGGQVWSAQLRNVVVNVEDVVADWTAYNCVYAFGRTMPANMKDTYVIGTDTILLSHKDTTYTGGRYASRAAVKAAQISFDNWDKDFWQVVDGVPYPTGTAIGNILTRLTKITDKSQVTNGHDYRGGVDSIPPRQTVGVNKGSLTPIQRIYEGCGCHAHTIHYFGLNLTKAELIAVKAAGKTKVRVAFTDESNVADFTVDANIGSKKVTITVAGAWDYMQNIMEISLQDIIDNYDTISAQWYAMFTVNNSGEVQIAVSDMVIA